jgi:hypothetical protein
MRCDEHHVCARCTATHAPPHSSHVYTVSCSNLSQVFEERMSKSYREQWVPSVGTAHNQRPEYCCHPRSVGRLCGWAVGCLGGHVVDGWVGGCMMMVTAAVGAW